jgi:hypothetical protein
MAGVKQKMRRGSRFQAHGSKFRLQGSSFFNRKALFVFSGPKEHRLLACILWSGRVHGRVGAQKIKPSSSGGNRLEAYGPFGLCRCTKHSGQYLGVRADVMGRVRDRSNSEDFLWSGRVHGRVGALNTKPLSPDRHRLEAYSPLRGAINGPQTADINSCL